MPLGITICRNAYILYFAIASVFVSQLYNLTLAWEPWLISIIGSILAGVASVGSSGITALCQLGLVLTPLGLPLEVVLTLLIIIDPLLEPLRAMNNMLSNCAVVSLIAPRHKIEDQILSGAVVEQAKGRDDLVLRALQSD
ncbi:cation:dicarboxylate symporter family transporter [Magnetococcus sp. PR-3]|uniref:cation:dicarboxylate symporter family transporter n=1 Tax=Magnetococcus sp. PR-3 TaxID=3120355 RepID=UPI003FA5F3BB